MKKFARIMTLLFVLVLCFSIVGCSNSSSTEKDKDTVIINAVKSRISATIYLEYGKSASITCYIKLVDTSYDKEEYFSKGKITVYDMGDKYVGEYTATAYYYLEDGKVSVSSINIGKLYKQ
ncbi:MAG: hypothetical protein IJF75_00325 [Clostridia bacterium]|nr:hypothetical protein [Clostridia bacterium]